jgi:hypothetical protein
MPKKLTDISPDTAMSSRVSRLKEDGADNLNEKLPTGQYGFASVLMNRANMPLYV